MFTYHVGGHRLTPEDILLQYRRMQFTPGNIVGGHVRVV